MRRRIIFIVAGIFLLVFMTAMALESYGQASRRVRRMSSGIAPVAGKAENQIQCTGKVVDADGQPVLGAAVKFYLFEYYSTPILYDVQMTGEQTTQADGAFVFRLEEKKETNRYGIIVAEKDAYALGWANWNASRNQELEIKLTQAKELSGIVVDEQDTPIQNAVVSIYMLLMRDGNDQRYLTSRAATKLLTATTDSTGAFSFGKIPESATAEFCVQASGRATINTFKTSGYGGEDLRYKAGQADIKLVSPVESKIQGMVVEAESGKPVAGVRLLALQEQNRPSFGQEPVETKADGTFTFGGLPAGTQYLTLVPPKEGMADWIGKVAEVTTETAKTTSDVKVEISKGGLLEVMVRDDQNQDPVAGASVSIFQMDNTQRQSEKTNAKGVARFRVLPGQCVVQYVSKEGYQRSQSPESATVEFDKTARVELQLRSMPQVTGVVRDPQGNPVEGVNIRILPGGGRQDVQTDDEGKFSVVWDKTYWGSQETTFCLVARHEEKNLAVALELDEENTTLDIKLSEGITFTGKVVDPEGKGIAGADIQVMLRVANWGSSMDSGRSCQTDAEGKFQVKAIPSGNRFNLYARAQGYGQKSKEVESDNAQEGVLEVGSLDLALANLTVTGTVVDVDDKPVAGASISTYGEGQPDRGSIKSDDQGKFTVDNVCAGRIRLSAYVRGGRQLRGYVETEGGATDVKVVVSEESRSTRFVPKQPPSLQGKTLTKFEELKLSVAPADIQDKAILLCFWDIQQRPSRHCLRQLAQQQSQLSEKGVKLLAVQTSQVEENALQEWTKKYQITFPVSTILEPCEETCFSWGVRSLPWLVLTDAEHRVVASGFGLAELEEKVNALYK